LKLLVQPDDGVVPVILAMQRAKKTLDLPIFRLDHVEIDRALKAAVKRGVVVRTLVAHTNKGGEKSLRRLEQRLLATGATVSRTDDDLFRYHYKIVVVDRQVLLVLGFNFTRSDIDRHRSMGLFTRNRRLVAEALRLFEADFDRRPYAPSSTDFVVSPYNARGSLAALLRGAKKQLLIYDQRVTDNAMLRILAERAAKGVEIRVLGRIEKPIEGVRVEKYPGTLHLRAIVQDGRRAFIGSQSLRRLELEARREVGVVFRDARVIARMAEVFEEDWARTDAGKAAAEERRRAEAKAEAAPKRAGRKARRDERAA
jgi:phosphatidylserine/phosphatidylglycerophosphate/cardiolipin synthase-like enzyme